MHFLFQLKFLSPYLETNLIVFHLEVFSNSLKGGFANAEDYLKVWIANIDYHRRRITDWTIGND